MGKYIELIGQLKPKNGGTFPIADVNDLKGGYIQLEKITELAALPDSKLKEGMLAYVSDANEIYQYRQEDWNPWKGGGGDGTGGAGVKKVATLEDLNDEALKFAGQIIFVEELKDLRYYDGIHWKSFNRIYIQAVPPEDKGGIWIDTSDDKVFRDSNQTIQNLVEVISILQSKMRKLEWALNNTLDFGDFTNNHYAAYDGHEDPIEPSYGTNSDDDEEEMLNILLKEIVEETEPTKYKDKIPNATHLCIKSGTYAQMIEHKNDFLAKELLWVEDTRELWIKDPKTNNLIKIGSTGGGAIDPEPGVDPNIMKDIITDSIGGEDKIVGINFSDMADPAYNYQLRVVNGKIELYNLSLDIPSLQANVQPTAINGYHSDLYKPIMTRNANSPMIYINSIYCGGKDTEKDYNPCSHNFIEISNVAADASLNLKGLYLHYTERNEGKWVTLPLKGIIKPNQTLLIRGAQCSVMDVNTTKIKVKSFDIEWTADATLHPDNLMATDSNIWSLDERGGSDLIQFSNDCAFYLSGPPLVGSYEETALVEKAPWSNVTGKVGVIYGYIDLVGIGIYEGFNMPSEKGSYPTKGNNILFHKRFTMDFLNQVIKGVLKRDTNTFWTHIDLENTNPKINVLDYTPKASYEHKGFFYNKHLLKEDVPTIVTCSFGQNAHKTRCFNWVSSGYYDEYIWFADEPGAYVDGVKIYESFKKGDTLNKNGTINPNSYRILPKKNWEDKIYDRIRNITTDGTAFTSHKFIIDFTPEDFKGQEEKTFYYKVGTPGAWSEEKSFIIRTREFVLENGYNFLSTTDQQGFIAEEYETWKTAADSIADDKKNGTDPIKTRDYQWTMNTGDMAQSGSRINEWIDYFNAGNEIFKETEQMVVVGNNDLSPTDPQLLGRGNKEDKTNPILIEFYFTYEHPFKIPKTYSENPIYIPSLYSFIYGDTYFLAMNSEITEIAMNDVYKKQKPLRSEDNLYLNEMKDWYTADIEHFAPINPDSGTFDPDIKWRTTYMHYAPFALLNPDIIRKFDNIPTTDRAGSYLNSLGKYEFSKFLIDYEVNLTICGHRHTHAVSRYMRDNLFDENNEFLDVEDRKTMTPLVYDPEYRPATDTEEEVFPAWYIAERYTDDRKKLVQFTNRTDRHYTKFIMGQATGDKLSSNSDQPAQNIPWLENYHPLSEESWDSKANGGAGSYKIKVNPAQQFPHYIIWNVGKGTETHNIDDEPVAERNRMLGRVWKMALVEDDKLPALYDYNNPTTNADVRRTEGNGSVGNGGGTSSKDLIVVEKLFKPETI